MAFCKEFNAATQKQAGDILPVVITVFKDKSFTFITKSPPAAILIEEGREHRRRLEGAEQDQGRQVTQKQIMEIVKTKMQRPEFAQRRSRLQDHRRHRPPDGPRDRRLVQPRREICSALLRLIEATFESVVRRPLKFSPRKRAVDWRATRLGAPAISPESL